MKYLKFLPVVFLSLVFVTTSSMAQDKMMDVKKDDGKMSNEKMDKDKMMHDDMMMRIDKDENGLAIKGYDPVAYFTDGKAVMGKTAHSYKWNDAEWHFASADHLKMFKENPGKYAPQYGGFCAYGVTQNHCGTTDPTAWKIVDGKLYLTTNEEVEMTWEKDIKGNIKTGDKYWMMLNKGKQILSK